MQFLTGDNCIKGIVVLLLLLFIRGGSFCVSETNLLLHHSPFESSHSPACLHYARKITCLSSKPAYLVAEASLNSAALKSIGVF